jgi:hypothetical protein
MRIVTSDWHVTDGDHDEACNRNFVSRLVDIVIAQQAQELILAGDIIDVTRKGRGIIPIAAAFLGSAVGIPLAAVGIPVTYILGNHDWIGSRTSDIARALYASGFPGGTFVVSTGPEFRGAWQIEHGNRFDPWCDGNSILTEIGEAATRADGIIEEVGIDLDPLDPTNWHAKAKAPDIDTSSHREAFRWSRLFFQHLVIGHSHVTCDVEGHQSGKSWRVLGTGSLTKNSPFGYVWISDDGQGGVKS